MNVDERKRGGTKKSTRRNGLPLRAALACLLAALLAACQVQPSVVVDTTFEMRVLHSNDTHSFLAGQDAYGNACQADADCVGGSGRLAAAVRAALAETPEALVLDAGDQFQGSLFFTEYKWPVVADVNKAIGYDAMTLGNHEFDDGCAPLAEFIRALDYPVVAANLQPGESCPLRDAPLRPYLIREIQGRKVGIVGLITPELPHIAAPCADMAVQDPASSLRAAVRDLEAQDVRVIIALTHEGLAEDRALARAVDGVDLIVGGHSHSWLAGTEDKALPPGAEGPYPVVEHAPSGQPVLVVTAKNNAEYLGDLRVTFDARGVPVRWDGAARRLEASLAPDREVSVKLAGYAAGLEKFRSRVLGSHQLTYADGKNLCRSGDCLSGFIVTDAMLEYARPFGASVAVINGGSLRAPLAPGEITQGALLDILPFGNTIVIREYSGADLLAALEHSVAEPGGNGARLLHAAGLRYACDVSLPVGRRVLRAEIVDERGVARAVTPEASYRVTLPDFLASGGDGYAMLQKGVAVSGADPLDVDIVADYVRRHSPLPMPLTGRLIKTGVNAAK